jgi:PAP2 superfamily protein
MANRSDNLNLGSDNLNLNLNLGASAGGVTGYGRPRFNTEDMDKLLPAPVPTKLKLPTKQYSPGWDPELRAWAYVQEFILDCNWGGKTPVDWLYQQINTFPGDTAKYPNFAVPYYGATVELDDKEMANQVVGVANASLDRADRAMEILDQATAPGALNYWTGLIRIDPSQEKHSFLLMLIARKIGEYVAMGLKDKYRFRRPSQVYPLLFPIVDPPDTPSFPSSHSTQAHLISGVLTLALKYPGGLTAGALRVLANRVARNREIAGVHYPMDSDCGAFVAIKCLDRLSGLAATSRFKTLVKEAAKELKDLP